MGTPQWAVASLRALLTSPIDVAGVVTNPDKPAGRGMEPSASPVKIAALESGLDVLQPARARGRDLHAALTELNPDVAIVVAYGKILPGSLLAIPPLGFVNVHFSLLPLYRGAAPVQRALMDGVEETGVSIMVLTEGMDEGPVLATRSLRVGKDDTAGDVGDRLAAIGAELLVPTLLDYAAGRLDPLPQNHDRASYAPKLDPDDARIDWKESSIRIHNLVRALNPAPGAWTTMRGARLKIYRTRPLNQIELGRGELDARNGLVAGTSSGALELLDVQLAGKRRMTGPELARGLRLEPYERLE
jgi:methionyl-tRNA formyltransferase